MAHNGEGEGEMTREGAIAQRAMENALEFRPINISDDVDLDAATKIPLGKIAALGMAFSPLIQAFGPAATGAGEVLLRATDHFGNAIDPSMLFKFKEYTGSLGTKLGGLNDSIEEGMLQTIIEARNTDVLPFVASLASINRLYNKPSSLLVDKEAIYIMPNSEFELVA